jgi:hypothetical protein
MSFMMTTGIGALRVPGARRANVVTTVMTTDALVMTATAAKMTMPAAVTTMAAAAMTMGAAGTTVATTAVADAATMTETNAGTPTGTRTGIRTATTTVAVNPVADGVLPRWTRNSSGASPAKAAGRIMNSGVVMATIKAEVAGADPRAAVARAVQPIAVTAADPPTPAAGGVQPIAIGRAVQPVAHHPVGAILLQAVLPPHIAAGRLQVNTGTRKASSPVAAAVPAMAAEAIPITTNKNH